jgi:hypothetical protein
MGLASLQEICGMSPDIKQKTKEIAEWYFSGVKDEKPFELWRSFDYSIRNLKSQKTKKWEGMHAIVFCQNAVFRQATKCGADQKQ